MKRGSLTKHIFCLINLDLDKMEAEEKISPLQNFRVHSCDLFVCVATAHLLTCRFSGKDCKDANRAPPNDLPQCVSLCSDQGLPFHKLCKWKLGPQGPFFHWRSNLNFFSIIDCTFFSSSAACDSSVCKFAMATYAKFSFLSCFTFLENSLDLSCLL